MRIILVLLLEMAAVLLNTLMAFPFGKQKLLDGDKDTK